jgi:hypothetical protein
MDRLEEAGKAKRRTDAGVPDIANLSQLLRTIGAYVEKRQLRLIRISRYGESLAIEYEHAGGKRKTETVSAGSLYEFWAELYLQRSALDEK